MGYSFVYPKLISVYSMHASLYARTNKVRYLNSQNTRSNINPEIRFTKQDNMAMRDLIRKPFYVFGSSARLETDVERQLLYLGQLPKLATYPN